MPGTTAGHSTRSGTSLEQPALPRRRAVHPATQSAGVNIELARDACRAALHVRARRSARARRALVLVERLHLHGAPGAATRGQETMPVGHRAGSDLLHERCLRNFGATDVVRHDAAAIEEQQPADRAAEAQLALAVIERRVPSHGLRKRQAAQEACHHVGQRVDGCASALTLPDRQISPFWRIDFLERCRLDAVLLRKANGGRRQLPVGGTRRGDRRPGDDFFLVVLPLGDSSHAHRQPPRRATTTRRARRCRGASRVSCAAVTSASCVVSPGSQLAGTSSTPISISSSRSIYAARPFVLRPTSRVLRLLVHVRDHAPYPFSTS